RLAVTAAGVAAVLAQQRHNLRLEVDGPAVPRPLDGDGDASAALAVHDFDVGGAVADGDDVTVAINADDGGVAAAVAGAARDVALAQRDEELPAVEGVAQLDLARDDVQFRGEGGERPEKRDQH